jgi:GDP-D-mannose dehydratase
MTQNKVALITGGTGKDGSCLADLLLEKDYKFMVLNVELHL